MPSGFSASYVACRVAHEDVYNRKPDSMIKEPVMKNHREILAGMMIPLFLVSTILLTFNGTRPISERGGSILLFDVDIQVYIAIASSALSIFLFVISVLSYKKERRRPLLSVMIAFFLFAMKGCLIAADEVIVPEIQLVEPTALLLDFGILVFFFLGLVGVTGKKD